MRASRRDLLDAGTVASFLEHSVLPWDTVNYQKPGYWDFPFITTDVTTLAATGNWEEVLREGPPEDPYELIVQEYIATTRYSLPLTGVEFRILHETEGLLPFISLAEGIERHRLAEYPLQWQQLFSPVTINDVVILEARNTTGQDLPVVVGLRGWYQWDPDTAAELSNPKQGLIDV